MKRHFTALSVLAGALALPACAGPAVPTGESDGQTAEATQALTQCITIQRGTLGNAEDTHLADQTGRYGKNYGASQGFSTGAVGDGTRQALLSFDLSSIPPGATIASATATLSVLLNGGNPVDVHQVTAPWSEATVTHDSFNGAYDPAVAATLPGATPGNTTSADITALVSGWYDGTVANYGVLLEQTGGGLTTYTAGEHAVPSMRPALDVCYTTGQCFGQADGTACDDNDACTTTDSCQSGLCVGGGADPCVNGACTSSGASSYSCACDAGWTGTSCDVDVDDCAANPCLHGTCSDTGTNSYACACDAGWQGANCDADIDECASGDPCNIATPDPMFDLPRGAACTNTPGSYTCQCAPMFGGADCTTICPCVGDAAIAGDTVTLFTWAYPALGLAPASACTVDAAGDTTVDVPVDVVTGISLDAGSCSGYYQAQAGPVYPLTTPAQYDACKGTVDFIIAANSLTCTMPPCDTLTCQNGGTCVEFGSTGGCQCPPGWVGNVCEIPDPCVPSPCQNGGTCTTVGTTSYTCSCPSGFKGADCEVSCTPHGIAYETRPYFGSAPASTQADIDTFNSLPTGQAGYGSTTVPNMSGVSNASVFAPGGSSYYIGYHISTTFLVTPNEAGVWSFRYGCDYALGGTLMVDGQELQFRQTDMYAYGGWGDPTQYLSGSINLAAGTHVVETYGFEIGADGATTMQFSSPVSNGFVTVDSNNLGCY